MWQSTIEHQCAASFDNRVMDQHDHLHTAADPASTTRGTIDYIRTAHA